MTGSDRIIGVDESGKGDFFGPLVIVAFLAPDSEKTALAELGVRDSKLIAPKKLLSIDKKLREKYPYSVVVVGPEKYNSLYDKIKNLNRLLAWGHARAIENILSENSADSAVSDKFGKRNLIEEALMEKGQGLPLRQIVRGESILQVAAASIIARAEFVRQIDLLSEEFGRKIPRGASRQVDEVGRELVAEHGVEVLDRLAKKHFKNFYRATNPRLLLK